MFVSKVASGGGGQNSGLVLVFSQVTFAPVAIFLDGGYLTELRTAAAGALAAQQFAPSSLSRSRAEPSPDKLSTIELSWYGVWRELNRTVDVVEETYRGIGLSASGVPRGGGSLAASSGRRAMSAS